MKMSEPDAVVMVIGRIWRPTVTSGSGARAKLAYPPGLDQCVAQDSTDVSKHIALAALLSLSLAVAAAESPVPDSGPAQAGATGTTGLPSASLLAALEGFLRQRHIDVDSLNAEQMVDLMMAWYRVARLDSGDSATSRDSLVYRYGGWSEGCATGFKLSLLRRTGDARPTGDSEQLAGITLMFEPTSGADLAPFSTTSSEWTSLEAFMAAVQGSPAFKRFGAGKPMSVSIERGGLR